MALHDYGCTLKAYRRDVLENVRLYGEMHRFVPIYASWEGAKISEIPVNHNPRRFGVSKYGLGRVAEVVAQQPIGTAAEICCGAGEAFALYRGEFPLGVGVDISSSMLKVAMSRLAAAPCVFVQGDATRMPLADESVDTVFMLGGIHHVNDRLALFSEVKRILKPGGRFIWREPVSDFWLWRGIRAVIYRVSPHLDHATERPLLWEETVPVLKQVGMNPSAWRTVGFVGFCLFMNSDVLYFNRLFRFIPGIRAITRAFARLDDIVCRLPFLSQSGLIVVGCAHKPKP